MTDQLRLAFHDLAETTDHAAGSLPAPGAHDLWTRGRRARRRRVASSVLVAGAMLALAGTVVPAVTDQLATTSTPASYDEADLAVPDRLWTPSTFAPTATGDHPPGPLAVVGSAERRDGIFVTTTPTWFGVSAVDQAYRWLDLPGMSSEYPAEVSLSPDGRRLAYFVSGDPEASFRQSDVVGYAVYDTVTGDVVLRHVETDHGLSISDGGLVWSSDSSTLVAKYGQWLRRPSTSTFELVEAWVPGEQEVQILQPAESGGLEDVGPGPEGTMVAWRGRTLSEMVRISLSTGESEATRVRRGPGISVPGPPLYNPAGDRIAFRDDRAMRGDGWIAALHTAEVAADGAVGQVRELAPAWVPGHLLGWTDDRTLLARGSERLPRRGPVDRIIRYDVVAGTASTGIGLPPRKAQLGEVRVAADLLLQPLVGGREPERLRDFWWARAAGAGLMLGFGLVALRRVRRRREERVLAEGSDA
jgi:hypothetical protein